MAWIRAAASWRLASPDIPSLRSLGWIEICSDQGLLMSIRSAGLCPPACIAWRRRLPSDGQVASASAMTASAHRGRRSDALCSKHQCEGIGEPNGSPATTCQSWKTRSRSARETVTMEQAGEAERAVPPVGRIARRAGWLSRLSNLLARQALTASRIVCPGNETGAAEKRQQGTVGRPRSPRRRRESASSRSCQVDAATQPVARATRVRVAGSHREATEAQIVEDVPELLGQVGGRAAQTLEPSQ